MGRKWEHGENPPLSKNGRKKKKTSGGAHRFFDKKSPIFLISLASRENAFLHFLWFLPRV